VTYLWAVIISSFALAQFHTELSTGDPKSHRLEEMSFPYREEKTSPLTPSSCQTETLGVKLCKRDGTEELFQFSMTQRKNETQRSFDFGFEDFARSDLHLYVIDSPDDFMSNMTFNYYVFLPRTYLPSFKVQDDEFHVTISTGEKIIFDKLTGKIKSGVLVEKPMSQLPGSKNCSYPQKACRKYASPLPITYNGTGIMLEISSNGNLPIGDVESGKSVSPSPYIVNVIKVGEKKCTIPSKNLWFTNYEKAGAIFIKKDFISDEKLNDYIKEKCGFSL